MKKIGTLLSATGVALLVLGAAFGSMGCKPSKPSDALVAEFTAKEKGEVDGISIALNIPAAERAFDTSHNVALGNIMACLGNEMGFRVDVNSVKQGYFSVVKVYTIVEVPQKQLPGLTIKAEGPLYKIQPDATERIVVESAVDVAKGFDDWIKEGDHNAMEAGDSKTKDMVKAKVADKKEVFLKNVERVKKDLGAKNAWWVCYRKKVETTVPKDSPYWNLAGSLTLAKNYPNMVGSVFAMGHPAWVKGHGEVAMKESLNSFVVVLFEGNDGKMLKSEGFGTFMP